MESSTLDGELFVSNHEKAVILTQALPYIQQYHKKTIVIKYGGNAMTSEGLKEAVISDLVLLSLVGINVVLVHGAGPEITDLLRRLGHKTEFINGLRYTDEVTIDVAQMVMAGKANKDIVNLIQRRGGSAIGLCGIDGGLIKAVKLEDGQFDYGYVGQITDICVKPIIDVLERGYIPVIASVAQGMDESKVYNINADTAAAQISVALGAEKLILLTDVKGLMEDPHDEGSLISVVRLEQIEALKRSGIIGGGMIPKVECCEEAIRGGVHRAHIIDGRILHSLLIEMLSDEGIGTMFLR